MSLPSSASLPPQRTLHNNVLFALVEWSANGLSFKDCVSLSEIQLTIPILLMINVIKKPRITKLTFFNFDTSLIAKKWHYS
ncbi:MAG: hypothetical protein ACTSRS_19495 [Candidatus Helarchaeota archaeon]